MSTFGLRAQPKERPLLGYEENPSRHGYSRGQRRQPATSGDTPYRTTEQET